MDEQLFQAIADKDLTRVEELLAQGANPNATKNGQTAYQLVPHNEQRIKCALIEAGAKDPELRHALVWVISTGRVKAVKTLIEQGADINIETYSGSPIQVASGAGHTEIVKLLIEAGADIDAGSSVSTPLLEAIEKGHEDIAIQLIEAGANPTLTAEFHDIQPIATASAQGSVKVIKALIDKGADVNCQVSNITLNSAIIKKQAGKALESAFKAMERLGEMMDTAENISSDDDDAIKEIEGKIDRIDSDWKQQQKSYTEPENAIDTYPVIIASRCGYAEALEVLLKAGANPDYRDGEGKTAYDWAVEKQYSHILDVLKKYGITGNKFDPDRELLSAVEAEDISQVEALLKQGANVNTRDNRRQTRNETPLMLAVKTGNLDLVEVLLDSGADLNITDKEKLAKPIPQSLLEHTDMETIADMGYRFHRNALMMAAEYGYASMVQLLLNQGANANYQDDIGYTPLLLACEKNHLSTAETLINHGADVTITNNNGETALMKASKAGNIALVRLLLEKGSDILINAVTKSERTTAIALAVGANHEIEVDGDDDSDEGITYREGKYWSTQTLPEQQLIEIIEILLQSGADINIPHCEQTPLINAAQNGLINVMKLLLDNGAKLELTDNEGYNAVSIADLFDRTEVLSFLKEYTQSDLQELLKDSEDYDDQDYDEDKYWGEEIPQPDFSAIVNNPDYLKAVEELAQICGSAATPQDDYPGWYSFHVNTSQRKQIDIEKLQAQFLTKGYFVYQLSQAFRENLPERLAIIPSSDKYDAIALHQTNGCNYDIGTGYILEWLKDLEQDQPFILTWISYDLISGKFLTPIKNPQELAEKMYDL